MGNRKKKAAMKSAQVLCTLLMVGVGQAEEFIPLPDKIPTAPLPTDTNPITGLADKAISATGEIAEAQLPNCFQVESTGAAIEYNQERNTLNYNGARTPIVLKADTGAEIAVTSMSADLNNHIATLSAPLTLYRGEMMVRASGEGRYDWQNSVITLEGIRAKINGLIIRGSSVEYKKDEKGDPFVVIHDAYVSTEDEETPTSWVGTGTLTIHPGDSGTISRLSVAGKEHDMAVPVFGWFEFTHSLNPKEGYLPNVGSKSFWGAYLLNSYGVLLGNRRTHGVMPTADYLATMHADYRVRRGGAFGLDFSNLEKSDSHSINLETYYVNDADPTISPLHRKRQKVDPHRYRVALTAEWQVTPEDFAARGESWKLNSYINLLSDRYMLRDFFENVYTTNDKPDNTVRFTRRTAKTQSMLYTRFAPNDYYMTDERLEGNFYRVRTPIFNTGINYETDSSVSFMRQYLPAELKAEYETKLERVKDPKLKEYYTRMTNANSFLRVNTTHELTASHKLLNFLNITPKVGGGYSGYYDVGGVGTDHRFLGYAACDVDFKLHRRYNNFSYKRMGLKGLSHIIHPYTSISHTSISSSNELVPKIDSWSSVLGNSTSSPMPLDLCSFTGIDGWGAWDIWRFGLQNVLNSEVDGDHLQIVNWNTFFDFNLDNPNTENRFSNLYTYVTLSPSQRLRFTLDTQTPTIEGGDHFYQHRISLNYQPVAWWEGRIGYTNIKGHPVQRDSEQLRLDSNLRINEKYTASARWRWDFTHNRMPIQQYSVFRNSGAWYVGASFYVRDNGGRKEKGFSISFTLGETGTALPIHLY